MVDPIGAKPVTASDRRATSVEQARVPTQVATVSAQVAPAAATPTVAAATVAVTRSLAAQPPVDLERVERIRSAIQRGTYPIVPETIADRLIALRLGWPNDAA
ncbi:MAG: flagellar biosynthesis anti-sigma factor FlgM [Sphingomonas sp.]